MTMTEWIQVNGARLDKKFFDENVREASNYDWTEFDVSTLSEHAHCMICGVTIDPNSSPGTIAHTSKGGYVCAHCHNHFLK